MNTQRNAARRLKEEIENARSPPCGAQVPPLEEDTIIEQSLVNPPPLMDGYIRAALIHLAQSASVQAQAMAAHVNQAVVARPHQQVTIMASHIKNFARMNPHTLYMCKVEEVPQEFIDEVYKIL